MVQVETPAQALNYLIQKCLQFDEGISVSRALTKISGSRNKKELYQFMTIVEDLVLKLSGIIKSGDFDDDQQSDITIALNSFQSIFNLDIMHVDWRNVRTNALPLHHVQTLKMMGPGIRSVASQRELSSDEVHELEKDVDELMKAIADAVTDERIKNSLLSHLRLVKFHLMNYRIGGKEALRKAISYVAGDLVTFREEYAVEQDAVRKTGLLGWIGKMINRMRAVSDDLSRIEATPENVTMITDLFGNSVGQ